MLFKSEASSAVPNIHRSVPVQAPEELRVIMQLFITVSRMHMPKVASCPLLPSESLGNFAVIPYVYCFTNFFSVLSYFQCRLCCVLE